MARREERMIDTLVLITPPLDLQLYVKIGNYALKIAKPLFLRSYTFLELAPSYNLTTTHLTYNPFLYIKSAILDDSFDLLFILPGLIMRKL